MEFSVKAIAVVHNDRSEATDDYWGSVVSEIRLTDDIPGDSIDNIEDFSHLEIIYMFHKADATQIVSGSAHPRENPEWTRTGIFGQRKRNRPNLIGATMVKLLRREGRSLFVSGLDAIDGTPVIDIKPVMKEFLPVEEIKQPAWCAELMKNYWK